MKQNESRTLLFKLITGIIVLLPIIWLITLVHDFHSVPDINDSNLNEKINQRNSEYAKGNSFGFTDRQRSATKAKGVFRIGVLGDSFIWGDGMPYEQVWSHKLETKLLAKYDSVEVIHWGKCGWSTLDEFNFFKEHGKDFDLDLLLIGWVDNDPDMGIWPMVTAKDPAKEYPGTFRIFPSVAQGWVNREESEEYDIWMSNLYSRENLKKYQKLLADFHTCLNGHFVNALYVMTPSSMFQDDIKLHFDSVEPLIRTAGFDCLNLYEPVEKKLGHYSREELSANPVNTHPGKLLTEEFSNEVIDYLEAKHYLAHLPKK